MSDNSKPLFYSKFRPTLIIFQIFAFMPVNNIIFNPKNSQKLNFSFKSIHTICTLVGYLGGTLLLFIIKGSITGKYINVIHAIICAQNVAVTLLHIYKIKDFINLIKYIDIYDHDVLNYTKKYNEKILSTLLNITVISWNFIWSIYQIISIYRKTSSFEIILYKYVIYPSISGVLLYIFIAFELKNRFRILNDKFISLTRCGIDINELDKIRCLHLKLINSVHILNDTFGTVIYTNLAFKLFNALHNLYLVIYFPNMSQDERITYTSLNLVIIYVLVVASESLYTMASTVKTTLFSIDVHDEFLSEEVKLFNIQIEIMENAVSEGGIVCLNKSIFGKITMIFVTYFITLVQLSDKINEFLVRTFTDLPPSELKRPH